MRWAAFKEELTPHYEGCQLTVPVTCILLPQAHLCLCLGSPLTSMFALCLQSVIPFNIHVCFVFAVCDPLKHPCSCCACSLWFPLTSMFALCLQSVIPFIIHVCIVFAVCDPFYHPCLHCVCSLWSLLSSMFVLCLQGMSPVKIHVCFMCAVCDPC